MAAAPTTLFDLAGVTAAADLTGRWPAHLRWEHGDYDDVSATKLLEHLQAVLEFRDVVTSAAPTSPSPELQSSESAVSIGADVHVNLANTGNDPLGVVHSRLPDFCMRLVSTDGTLPARLSWTRFADGTSELVLFGLPVQIEPPADLLSGPDEDPVGVDFDNTHPDSLGVRLQPLDEGIGTTFLKCFVTLRLTRAGDVLIQPTVPISLGRCIFMGVPSRAVHDLAFYPDVAVQPPAHMRELPIGWAASERKLSLLAERVGTDRGLLTVRTVELDRDSPAVRQVYDFFKTEGSNAPPLEIPIDDLALAFDAEGGVPLPAYPVFGQVGIRRAVSDDTAAAEPFDHTLAPIRLSIKDWLYVFIHRFLIAYRELPQAVVDLAVTRDPTNPEVRAVTVNFTQDYTLLLGIAWDEPVGLFRVGNTMMSFLAGRVGANFKRLIDAAGFKEWADVVVDLALVGDAASKDDKINFRTRSGGRLDLVLRDVGWKDGKPSVSAWIPDGVSLSILGAPGFHIDEIGLATTTHGATYFRLSASYQVGGKREVMGRPDEQQHPPGNGIWLRGLRIRIQEPEDSDTPEVAIDGIAISIKASDGSTVEGGGWLTDEVVGGNRIRELGFGIRIFKPAGATEFVFGGLLVKGTLESADRTTDYLLVGVTLGPIPFGSFALLRGSILVAKNFVPRLPEPSGVEQNLRLFNWYRSQPHGLELPPGRVMGAWQPQPDSWTVGVGLRLSLASSSVIKLDAFGLWLKSPETWVLLIGLELRFKDNQDPIGWFAVEYDDASGRWAATGGIALGLDNVLEDQNLPELAELTGSVYVSNEPRTVAIGHIEDVDSWLQFKVQYERFDLLLRVGFCFYDYDGDPPINAYGFVVTGKGAFRIPRLTEAKFLLEVSVMLGSFSSDGRSAGILATVEVALRIKVWRLRFGIRARIEIEHIKPHPDAGTATLDFTIETPWWLPDIHISHTWTFGGEPELEAADVISMPVNGAQALELAGGTAVDLAVLLPAGADDAARPYSLGELAQLGAPAPDEAVLASLTPVPVDSVIAIDFAAAVTDGLGTGETTPFLASRQENGELYADYEVVEVGVRRRPRYGPDAGVWTTLVAPEDTSTAAVDPVNDTVDELVAKFTSELGFRWDRDLVRGGKLDARRLLLNAATPFTLTNANPIADEALLDDPDATCCGKRRPMPWVTLGFEADAVGVRLPRVTPFPGDHAQVRWHGLFPPVVIAGAFSRLARLPLTGRGGTTLATIRFDQPAARALAKLTWSSAGPAIVRLELHRGLKVVAAQNIPLGAQLETLVQLSDGEGGDELVIRLIGPGGPVPLPTLYVDTLAYVGTDALTAWLLGLVSCERGGTLASGTLAWLPNHDYEIAVACKTTVGHNQVGEASVPVRQTALFRTKGWPGLNAPATPGGDLTPFVEASYPRSPERLLYRDEPILLAMNERFSPLAPAVDAPPTAPPERRQLLEWSMLVDEVGTGNHGTVATYSSPDWLSANRQQPGPPGPLGSRLDAVLSHVRQARSLDPRFGRVDGIRRSPANCQPHDPTLHNSRIFACEAPEHGWAQGAYRARVVQRHGPYVMRTAFEPDDLTALTMLGGAWTFDDGALVGPDGGVEAWAVLGDPTWLHVRLLATLDLAGGGSAGLAVAVHATDDAIVAIVDAAAGRLRLERRRAGAQDVLAEADIPTSTAPVTLELIGYDDEVVARLGDVEARAPRGDRREGRVALVGGPAARVTNLYVEPVEAYTIDVLTSRWRTFESHVAAYRDAEPFTIGATGAELAAWLTAEWDRIAAAMAPDADPRTRSTVFRTALESLGIAALETPRDPVLTRLLAGGASVAILLEGPEPLPFSADVTATLQRRPKKPFPHPHFPFEDVVVLDTGGGSPQPSPPSPRPPRGFGFPISPRPEVISVDDLEPLQPPVDPPQWLDVGTLVLTDDDERRALVIPVDLTARTPLPLTGPAVRLRLELDRERYRSAVPDPAAQAQATVIRTVAW
jgi:hypothetical protein